MSLAARVAASVVRCAPTRLATRAPTASRGAAAVPGCCATRGAAWVSTAAGGGGTGRGNAADGVQGSEPDTEETHFGFRSVAAQHKEELVGEVFHSVADSYDVMNDLMSGGVHRLWKDEFVRMLMPVADPAFDRSVRLLDIAGGTGDIAFRIADAVRGATPPLQGATDVEIVVSDINASMLGVGRERAEKLGYLDGFPRFDWVEANAEELPFEDDSFDAYTISFGIRNVTHIDRALAEAHRVLRKGGRFMCLEFSYVSNPLIRQVYDAYSFGLVPEIGAAVANDRDAYQYLVESIRKFPRQEEFAAMIRAAGFQAVEHCDFTFGVVAVHSGIKV